MNQRVSGHSLACTGVTALLLSFVVCLSPPPVAAANALAGSPSPYLAMHAQDPVEWRPWGPEVLAEARRQGRPLFISSGYFACHWCHVMQRESYRDPHIAARLNSDFIPVKLDRELHTALDAHLIGFVERTAGQAGWPLNVFLTPEGYPLLGLTYAPPQEFGSLLERVAEQWKKDKAILEDLARRAADEQTRVQALSRTEPEIPEEGVGKAMAERLKRQALLNADQLAGGFGHQTRFPMAPTLSALLEVQAREPDPDLAAFLRLTLDAMADKGLRDHLGGGFFRYTVDPDWQTPHFEKMLYTQALLIPLYLRAAEVLEVPEYREIARETIDFVLTGMKGKDGAYISSLSAVDADGVEGGTYLWRPQELEILLDADEQRLAAEVWGMQGTLGQLPGYLPRGGRDAHQAAAEIGLAIPDLERLSATTKSKLSDARSKRDLPRDGKQLAGWNGLVLSALAAATDSFQDASYRNAGLQLSAYLRQRLWDGTDLHRAASHSGWIGEATLEDYAFVAKGLRDWALVSGTQPGTQTDLDLSRRLVVLAWERFRADGGWRPWAEPLLPGVAAEAVLADNPLPSPAAILLHLTLSDPTKELLPQARKALHQGLAATARVPFVFAGQAILYLAYPSLL